MKRRAQLALLGVVVLAVTSLAAAQGTFQVPSGTPTPSMRFGNFIEIGNDVLMHIIAQNDLRFQTTNNFDCDGRVRDRVPSRSPSDTREQGGEADTFWILSRFGVDFRYQKNLETQLLLEQRTNLDTSGVKGRNNNSNPGGTSVF